MRSLLEALSPGSSAALAAALVLGAPCRASRVADVGGETSFYATRAALRPPLARMVAAGRALFFDASLSASGTRACASCHDPRFGYGPASEAPVALGGSDGRQPGLRAVPSLRYLQRVPSFSEHFVDDDGDDSVDQGPAGGLMWDGRARSLHEQALLPLLSPFEMANADVPAFVLRLRRSRSAPILQAVFGAEVLDDPDRALRAALTSLEFFEQNPADFHPYTSRYDAWLRGERALSAAERRGLALFEDPGKGNCAACHPSRGRDGPPAFSDWGFVALGVPRNPRIPANRDEAYFDLGLCGPLRADLASRREYCGRFRTPTLRNVAVRRVLFHNGIVHRLEDGLRFYVERDTRPENWYPSRAGGVASFDDLPPEYRENVEREPPFGGRPGDRPRLDPGELRDLAAFLRTLTDADLDPETLDVARPRFP